MNKQVMNTKARYQVTRSGLLISLGVLLTMALGTATLRASPIDKGEPDPYDPSAYHDESADEATALDAMLTMPEANNGSYDLPDVVEGSRMTPRQENALPPAMPARFNYPTLGTPSLLLGALPTFSTGDGFGPHVTVNP